MQLLICYIQLNTSAMFTSDVTTFVQTRTANKCTII